MVSVILHYLQGMTVDSQRWRLSDSIDDHDNTELIDQCGMNSMWRSRISPVPAACSSIGVHGGVEPIENAMNKELGQIQLLDLGRGCTFGKHYNWGIINPQYCISRKGPCINRSIMWTSSYLSDLRSLKRYKFSHASTHDHCDGRDLRRSAAPLSSWPNIRQLWDDTARSSLKSPELRSSSDFEGSHM